MSKNNKSVRQSKGHPVLAVVVITILVLTILGNGVSIMVKYAKGYGGRYKASDYEMYSVSRERYGDIADTYQRSRYKGIKNTKNVSEALAVGEYYIYALIRDAYLNAGDEESAEYFVKITDDAHSRMGQFSYSTETMDEIISDAIK